MVLNDGIQTASKRLHVYPVCTTQYRVLIKVLRNRHMKVEEILHDSTVGYLSTPVVLVNLASFIRSACFSCDSLYSFEFHNLSNLQRNALLT